MSKPTLPCASGPATHYELFAGLRDNGVAYLVTGAAALVLHGVPRLTPDVDLAVDPAPANFKRLERLLAVWGYGEAAAAAPMRGIPMSTRVATAAPACRRANASGETGTTSIAPSADCP